MGYSNCCGGFWPKYSDDVFMGVAIVWNIFPLFFLMSSYYREQNSVPLNNAILAASALLFSILVQWKWANFHTFDIEIHEAVARSIVLQTTMQRGPAQTVVNVVASSGEGGGGTTPNGPTDSPSVVSAASITLAQGRPIQPKTVASAFDTVNFLSTASMVRDYGLGYAKSVMMAADGSSSNSHGLRKRRNLADEDGGGNFMMNSKSSVRRGPKMAAAMPYYTALVTTGAPLVQYNYMNLIHVSVSFFC